MIKTMTFRDRAFQVAKGSLHPEFSFFTFEEEERDIRERYWNVQEGDVVIDAGASYGSYTLAACAMGARVYAFEPEPRVFDDLVKNLELNGWLYTRCFPFNLGLWDEQARIGFESYAPHWPQHTISGPYSMETLDHLFLEERGLLELHKLDRIDWIKVDVEGAEGEVLRGARRTIERFRPKMLIETHVFLRPDLKDMIVSELRALHADYEVEEIPRDPCIMLVVT